MSSGFDTNNTNRFSFCTKYVVRITSVRIKYRIQQVEFHIRFIAFVLG
jgi:hypothetical protein